MAGGESCRRRCCRGYFRSEFREGDIRMSVNDLISGMLKEDGGFQKAFKEMLDNELDMTVNEFCQEAGISQSTMYKMLEDKREPNLRTIRAIIKAAKLPGADHVQLAPGVNHRIGQRFAQGDFS